MQSEPHISRLGLWKGISLIFSAVTSPFSHSFLLSSHGLPLPYTLMILCTYILSITRSRTPVGQGWIMLFSAIHAILSWDNLQSLLSVSLLLHALIFYPHDRQMISYKQIWSLYLLLTDVCIFREVLLGCIHIQMARGTQESQILSLSSHSCHSLLFVSALVRLSFESLEHI